MCQVYESVPTSIWTQETTVPSDSTGTHVLPKPTQSIDYTIVLVRVSIAEMKQIETKKQVWEERVYLTHTSMSLFINEGSQNRNYKAGQDPGGRS